MVVRPCRAAMQVDLWSTSALPGITLSIRGMVPSELRNKLLKDSFTKYKFPSAQASSIVEGCFTREEVYVQVAVNVVGCERLLGSCVGFRTAQPVLCRLGTVTLTDIASTAMPRSRYAALGQDSGLAQGLSEYL